MEQEIYLKRQKFEEQFSIFEQKLSIRKKCVCGEL